MTRQLLVCIFLPIIGFVSGGLLMALWIAFVEEWQRRKPKNPGVIGVVTRRSENQT